MGDLTNQELASESRISLLDYLWRRFEVGDGGYSILQEIEDIYPEATREQKIRAYEVFLETARPPQDPIEALEYLTKHDANFREQIIEELNRLRRV